MCIGVVLDIDKSTVQWIFIVTNLNGLGQDVSIASIAINYLLVAGDINII